MSGNPTSGRPATSRAQRSSRLGELASRVAEVPADRDVVVVCRSGNRSAQGRDILLGAGYAAVTSMAGGMNDWAGSGRPVVTGP